mgnify:CR=1 FL=1
MGAVASIDQCYGRVCCPKDNKALENNQIENSHFENGNDKKISLNMSIDNDNDFKNEGNIFLFEKDDYESDVKKPEPEDANLKLEQSNFIANSSKNNNELINENNKKDSSKKSGLNISNFSFKVFIKNDTINNEINNDLDVKQKAKTNKAKKNIYIFKEIEEKNDNIKNKNQLSPDFFVSQVIKIQRYYRLYNSRKIISEKRTNFRDDNIDELNNELNKDKIISSKNCSSSLLKRYPINIEYVDVSEESFRSVTLKSNQCKLEPFQFCTLRELDIDQVKGYFLLKNKMFRYQGRKDKNGKKNGFGRIFWEDSSKLKGYFKDSKLNGIVYFYNYNNEASTFFGEYKDNIPEGYGIYSRKGFSLEGMNWNKNCLNDIGVAIWGEGEIYEGEFKDSLKEGLGLYRWADGTTYMGEFKKGKITGIGRMQFANGNYYEGEFIDGYISGWGKFIWDDGNYYIGNYLNNKKHGFGIFVWTLEPLNAVIGFWSHGKQNGICVRLFKGHCKFALVQESNSNILLNTKWEISKYLKPSQIKYKNLFKKKYNEFTKLVTFASK